MTKNHRHNKFDDKGCWICEWITVLVNQYANVDFGRLDQISLAEKAASRLQELRDIYLHADTYSVCNTLSIWIKKTNIIKK